MIDQLAMAAVNGFELSDHHLYASEVLLAAGDLPAAADYADRLAALPFNRADEYLGLARRLKVGALAGDFDAVVEGRPAVPRQLGAGRASGRAEPRHAAPTPWRWCTGSGATRRRAERGCS